METNKIYTGDCLKLIPKLPEDYVDLVVTSPPYNVDLGKNKYNRNPYDLYLDNKDHKEYVEWLQEIFYRLKSKMVSGGRICINIGDSKNGAISTHSDVIQFMKELKYLLKSTIIWYKNQIGNRAAWGSFRSPKNPSFPSPFEYILIFCKDSFSKEGDKKDVTVTKGEFIRNSLGMWKFAPESQMTKKYGHPAMFPLELPYRLISQLSYKNDLVLDPFSGAGTTCVAAELLNRKWIGFELSKNYARVSRERLKKTYEQTRII